MKNPFIITGSLVTLTLVLNAVNYYFYTIKQSQTEAYLTHLKSGTTLSPNEVLHKCVADKTCAAETTLYLFDDIEAENKRVEELLYKAIIGKKADPFYYPENEAFNALEYALSENLCGKLNVKRDINEYQEINKLNFTHISKFFKDCVRTLDDMLNEYHYNDTVLHQPYNSTHYEL